MNYLKPAGISLLLFLSCTSLQAQQQTALKTTIANKPSLFSNLPDQIPVDIIDLQKVFKESSVVAKNGTAKATFANKQLSSFDGKILSKIQRYQGKLQSLNIQPTTFGGAILKLSAITTDDGSIRYTGRIISVRNSDAFLLTRKDGNYFFIKKKLNELLME